MKDGKKGTSKTKTKVGPWIAVLVLFLALMLAGLSSFLTDYGQAELGSKDDTTQANGARDLITGHVMSALVIPLCFLSLIIVIAWRNY
jgi:1,4-dihydroxy-2-naphthoate octaprenyltransferase